MIEPVPIAHNRIKGVDLLVLYSDIELQLLLFKAVCIEIFLVLVVELPELFEGDLHALARDVLVINLDIFIAYFDRAGCEIALHIIVMVVPLALSGDEFAV